MDEMFEKGEFDDTFINVNVDKNIIKKLYDYQILHVYSLISGFGKSDIVIDGSNTGTGKTFTSIAIAKHFNLKPIIICPRCVVAIWKDVCNTFGCEPLIIVNYETIKNASCYENNDINNKRVKTIYLDKDPETKEFIWNILPKDTIIIFDEVHKCKQKNTLNSKLLLSTKEIGCKVLLCSATISDTPKNFFVFGKMLNLYKTPKQCNSWVLSLIKNAKNSMKKINPLHDYLFPQYGSVMYIGEASDNMPKNIICANCYTIDKASIKKINTATLVYDGADIAKTNYVRQIIEEEKVPIIVDLATNYLDHGKSVVIFVNFLKTLEELATLFETTCLIHGSQTNEERDNNIADFQSGRSRIIIGTLQSGGQSISLHDMSGLRPRASIISPSFSSIDLIQALGRVHRVGSRSYSTQNIVFCSGTQEEEICKRIKLKVNFLEKLTDADFNIG
jgi:superfamily II DNA or RNA helicase